MPAANSVTVCCRLCCSNLPSSPWLLQHVVRARWLLQDLTAYKKFKEKAVASAARSIITLFREIAPYMLEKKDRGRGADLEARPMQYGAGQVRVSVY